LLPADWIRVGSLMCVGIKGSEVVGESPIFSFELPGSFVLRISHGCAGEDRKLAFANFHSEYCPGLAV
jgi:hypothetical protein